MGSYDCIGNANLYRVDTRFNVFKNWNTLYGCFNKFHDYRKVTISENY